MSTDPITDELDRLRAEEMACHNFDFEAFYRDLKEEERLSPTPLLAPPVAATGSERKRSLFVRR